MQDSNLVELSVETSCKVVFQNLFPHVGRILFDFFLFSFYGMILKFLHHILNMFKPNGT
jgi:uncharacterized membrane protein